MTPTIAAFRTKFGEFSDTGTYTDAQIERAQELATRYAKNDELIHHYVTAHVLIKVVKLQMAGDFNPANMSAGRRTQITRGPQWVEFAIREPDEAGNHWTDPHWDETSYGAEARRLAEEYMASMKSVAFIR